MKTSLEAGHMKIKQYDWKRGKHKQRLSNFLTSEVTDRKLLVGPPKDSNSANFKNQLG